jgi:Tfp pilus assembly protein PilO
MNRHQKLYLTFIVILAAVATLTLGAEVYFFGNLSAVQANLAESNYRSEKIEDKVKNLENLEARYERIKDSSRSINQALPSEKESSQLLSDLDTLANNSGLKLTLLQASTFGKKAKKISDPALLQTVRGKYGYEMPIEVRVEGPYPNFVAFIKTLENYQRMIRIGTVEISRSENREAAPDNIEVKLYLTAYMQK